MGLWCPGVDGEVRKIIHTSSEDVHEVWTGVSKATRANSS